MILRTKVELTYDGVNLTDDIAPDLLSFSFSDAEGGKADDIDLALKNEHGRWSSSWLPSKGDKIEASIVQEGAGSGEPLLCGVFVVDELEVSGPPSVISIRGVSMPTETPITRTKRSRAWESVRLSEIAADVAKAGELELLFDVDPDPVFDRRDQREETDLAFLQRVSEDEGCIVKCTGDRLIVYDPRDLERLEPIATLTLGESNILTWRMASQSHDVFTGCEVEYKSPRQKKVQRYLEGNRDGKVMKVVRRAASIGEAERMAAAALYRANRKEITGSLSLVGDPRLVSGAAVELEGFGGFSGKYLIREAKHTVASGYTTTIDLLTTREG